MLFVDATSSSHIILTIPSTMTVVGFGVRNNVTVPPSNTARKASMRKGAVFPTNSYITLPNGGPTMERKTLDGQWW